MPDPKDLRARLDAASLTISLERSGSGSSSYAILEITSIARAALDEVEALRKEPMRELYVEADKDRRRLASTLSDTALERNALRERVRALEEALRPFASIGPYTSDWKDGHFVGDPNESFDFTMGDVHRACRLLIGS